MLRKKSQEKGIERLKSEVIKNVPKVSKEEVDEAFQAVYKEVEDYIELNSEEKEAK